LKVWLSGFILGQLLGQLGAQVCSCPWIFDWVYLLIPVAFLKRPMLTFLAALAFGLFHSAPPLTETGEEILKVRKNPLVESNDQIVRTSRGSFAVTKKLGKPYSMRDKVTYWPHIGLLSQGRSFLEVARPSNPPMLAFVSNAQPSHTMEENDADRVKRALIFGDKKNIPKRIKNDFKLSGLYHLLVVSGLHVSLVALMLSGIIAVPFRAFYACLVLSPNMFRQLRAFLCIFSAICAFIFTDLVGFSSAAQRALLVFAVYQISLVFMGTLPIDKRLSLIATCQSFIFPIGFIGESNIMSWAAYLSVANMVSSRKGIRGLFVLQIQLLIICGGCFGYCSLIAILSNFLLVPIFPIFFSAGILTLLGEGLFDLQIAEIVFSEYLHIIENIANFVENFPFLYLDLAQLPSLRSTLVISSFVLILNGFKNLSIRKRD
jgi:hypothetical protein